MKTGATRTTPTTRMTRMVVLASTAAAITILLAGCTGAAPTPPATSSGSASSPSVTPTPSQTAQPATPPALFGGDCAKLAPLATVLAATPKLALQPAGSPKVIEDIPLVQAGGIECDWRDATGVGGYRIAVLPNAAAEFTAHAADLEKYDDARGPAKIKDVPHYGDTSYTQCLSIGDDPAYGCDIDILVASNWIHVEKNDTTIIKPYPETAGLKQLLTTVVGNVREVLVVTPWVPQTDGITVPTDCAAALTTATLKTDTAIGFQFNPKALINGPYDDAGVSMTGSLKCQWGSTVVSPTRSTIQLIAVPGSSWAWPGDVPPKSASPQSMKPVAGLGDAAVAGCHISDCSAFVRVGHTWFSVVNIRAGGTASMKATIAIARSFIENATKS